MRLLGGAGLFAGRTPNSVLPKGTGRAGHPAVCCASRCKAVVTGDARRSCAPASPATDDKWDGVLTLEDGNELAQVMVFPDAYERLRPVIYTSLALVVRGTATKHGEGMFLAAESGEVLS